ncbi:hypothetical protein PYW08_015865 [Mythimna loreyi]|uniref:Uncharacterized protein n=1 Tax=Mythimna loreyi TaxID=667449 RepID=A0ACC2QU46_9NEOP|nr:hypothetical protein PYW08_015865 [Mythimna loreyi]
MTYGKVHRFFLRTVASQGVLSISDAQAVLERFNDEEQLSVTDVVRAINDEIRPYYQEIKMTQDEVTNEDCIVFLSLADDAATKAQNLFSATELEYFRLLIEQIMSTESRQITKIFAMNLVSSMKSSFTKTDAEKVLNTWSRMRYFEKEQDNYALGLRAIHEFEGYFRQNMEHAVEDCVLCKHIVCRGYNCPGCAKAIHTRCLMRYLEKVTKWPCCKLDYEQEQLERLRNESSRLPPTQLLDTTPHSEGNQTVAEPTQMEESSELMEQTQDTQEIIPEISQRVTRKRKRQISRQTKVPTLHPLKESITEAPVEDDNSRRSSRDSNAEAPIQSANSRRSSRESNAEAPIQSVTSRRSSKDSNAEAPIQSATSRRSSRDSVTQAPTEVKTRNRSKRSGTVAAPTQVTTTRRSTKSGTVAAPTQVTTTRRSTKSGTVEAPTQATTTNRSGRNSTVEKPTEETAPSRSTKRSNVKAPTQVTTTLRSTRSTPVKAIEESFKNMEVKEEVVIQRVTRKRKQQ